MSDGCVAGAVCVVFQIVTLCLSESAEPEALEAHHKTALSSYIAFHQHCAMGSRLLAWRELHDLCNKYFTINPALTDHCKGWEY